MNISNLLTGIHFGSSRDTSCLTNTSKHGLITGEAAVKAFGRAGSSDHNTTFLRDVSLIIAPQQQSHQSGIKESSRIRLHHSLGIPVIIHMIALRTQNHGPNEKPMAKPSDVKQKSI